MNKHQVSTMHFCRALYATSDDLSQTKVGGCGLRRSIDVRPKTASPAACQVSRSLKRATTPHKIELERSIATRALTTAQTCEYLWRNIARAAAH
jgi:hypothetical protein